MLHDSLQNQVLVSPADTGKFTFSNTDYFSSIAWYLRQGSFVTLDLLVKATKRILKHFITFLSM